MTSVPLSFDGQPLDHTHIRFAGNTHFFLRGGGGGGALGGTYPSVVRLRFGPGLGFDGSFGIGGLTSYVVAVGVAL